MNALQKKASAVRQVKVLPQNIEVALARIDRYETRAGAERGRLNTGRHAAILEQLVGKRRDSLGLLADLSQCTYIVMAQQGGRAQIFAVGMRQNDTRGRRAGGQIPAISFAAPAPPAPRISFVPINEKYTIASRIRKTQLETLSRQDHSVSRDSNNKIAQRLPHTADLECAELNYLSRTDRESPRRQSQENTGQQLHPQETVYGNSNAVSLIKDRLLEFAGRENVLAPNFGGVKFDTHIEPKKRRDNLQINMAPAPTQQSQGETLSSGGHDKPLVLGRTKPAEVSIRDAPSIVEPSKTERTKPDSRSSTPAESIASDVAPAPATRKEKAPKQPKSSKPPATPAFPLSPAVLDLRVGHILRCVTHPNADSLLVSTIAMGDAEGTEHTQKDEETGKIVRTVCSGLNGLIPLAEMQDRKVIVVANLKPVNMRSIKSAAMVLAASPKAEEGADPHAHDRVIELVAPPAGAEAGEKVYFEGWPYGEGKGPEKQLNPKKKQWEAIQPGFYTSEDYVVGFDAAASDGVEGGKGDLVVEGKGKCTVKSLKGAAVR